MGNRWVNTDIFSWVPHTSISISHKHRPRGEEEEKITEYKGEEEKGKLVQTKIAGSWPKKISLWSQNPTDKTDSRRYLLHFFSVLEHELHH